MAGLIWSLGLGLNPSPAAEILPSTNLHNVFAVAPRIFSGSSPENEAGFVELAKLGVKTVISVDGAKPDVEMARKHGLKYVHLPIGYDGIPTNRVVPPAAPQLNGRAGGGRRHGASGRDCASKVAV